MPLKPVRMSACYFPPSQGVAVTTPVLPQRLFGNFPSFRYAQRSLVLTHARTHARNPFSLPLFFFFYTEARATHAISSQCCMRPAPVAPACAEWVGALSLETLFYSLMEKKGWIVWSLHPLLVAWEGPTLWAERPQPLQKHYLLYY